MDVTDSLSEQERKFLRGAAKRRKLFLASSVATVAVAVAYLVRHGVMTHDMNGVRFVVILLLLLSGRSYLRLYKCASIFAKLVK